MTKKLEILGLPKKKKNKDKVKSLFGKDGFLRKMQFVEVKAVSFSAIKGALGKGTKFKMN